MTAHINLFIGTAWKTNHILFFETNDHKFNEIN